MNDRADRKAVRHLSSPLKNQTDILQTQLVDDWCLTWMYTLAMHLFKKYTDLIDKNKTVI